MNRYLIPANTKKSSLILGFFTPIDLAIFLVGMTFTLIMLVAIRTDEVGKIILMLSPLLISSFLVLPVPHYHNVLQLIINIITFLFSIKRYYWKGWSIGNEK